MSTCLGSNQHVLNVEQLHVHWIQHVLDLSHHVVDLSSCICQHTQLVMDLPSCFSALQHLLDLHTGSWNSLHSVLDLQACICAQLNYFIVSEEVVVAMTKLFLYPSPKQVTPAHNVEGGVSETHASAVVQALLSGMQGRLCHILTPSMERNWTIL